MAKTTMAVIKSPLQGIELLKEELKHLKKIQESSYKADVNMSPVCSMKISECTSVEDLITFHSTTMLRAQAYSTSMSVLGIEEAKAFKMNGGSLEDITDSIKLRIQIIQTEDRRKVLEELIKEGEGLLTQEHKAQLFAEKIERLTGRKA